MWTYKNISEVEIDGVLRAYGQRDSDNFGETEIIKPGKPPKALLSLTKTYGLGEFPFHTDVAYWSTPASYLALYCIEPGKGRRKTRVINLDQKLNDLSNAIGIDSDLFLIRHRIKPFFVKIINGDYHNRWVRWDQEVMSPVIDSKIVNRAKEFILSQEIIEIEWEPKMLVVMNNRMSLHARGNSIVDDSDRTLRRILIK